MNNTSISRQAAARQPKAIAITRKAPQPKAVLSFIFASAFSALIIGLILRGLA